MVQGSFLVGHQTHLAAFLAIFLFCMYRRNGPAAGVLGIMIAFCRAFRSFLALGGQLVDREP
jgi:hypothetical protein